MNRYLLWIRSQRVVSKIEFPQCQKLQYVERMWERSQRNLTTLLVHRMWRNRLKRFSMCDVMISSKVYVFLREFPVVYFMGVESAFPCVNVWKTYHFLLEFMNYFFYCVIHSFADFAMMTISVMIRPLVLVVCHF